MKKWTILVIVVLAGILLALQYVVEKKKSAVQSGGAMPALEEPVGVALPEGATTYMARQAENSMPEVGGAVYGSIVLPTIQTAYKGACEGGSLREMLGTHDKYWGFFAWDTPFTQAETQKMYGFLADYVACHAVARTDASLCDALPGPAEKKGYKVTLDMTPSFKCREKTVEVLFAGFRSGLVKEDFSCRATVSSWAPEYVAKVSVPELCSKLSVGRKDAAAYLLEIFKQPGAEEWINAGFPIKEAECKKEDNCMKRYVLYNGINTGKPQKCGADYAPHCQALAERTTVPCDKILQNMSEFYCASVKRVKKVTGGYIGMTKEEIAADIERNKAAKAEADTVKKEQEKAQEEVNKRVKEMLGKK
jgi:hypothetical protein